MRGPVGAGIPRWEAQKCLATYALKDGHIYVCMASMKTTIDLPDDLLHRAKVAAAQRRTTLKELVQTGLDWVLRSDAEAPDRKAALERLKEGLRLGGQPLTRSQVYDRR